MKKHIVMLGTSPHTMGGVSSVVNEYRHGGLFRHFPVIYISTHCDGHAAKKLLWCIVAWGRYMRLLLQGKVALVHAHMSSNASFWRKSLFFLPAFLFRRPTILHLHGAQFDRFYDVGCNRTAKWFVRYIFNRVDMVVVLSNTWQRWAKDISRNSRIRCLHNLVRLPSLGDFDRRDTASLLFLGRLGARKGTYDLLTAASRLVAEHPDLVLLLGGDGELERILDTARNMGIGAHVQVLGWVSGAQKSALLERASIYVLPSYAEGLPMSVLEAMAAGLPVVSTPVGGIPDIVTDGSDGFLVQPGDIDALCDVLKKLLSNADLRRHMGMAARNKVESKFSHSRIIPQIEQLYNELGVAQ